MRCRMSSERASGVSTSNAQVSADAPPDKLYMRGENAKMFERTASRLDEMQSQDWLAMPHLT